MFSARRSLSTVVALVTALVLPALAPAGGEDSDQFSAKLKGKSEVPGPGDSNGKGEAFVSVDAANGKLCFQVSWTDIDPPSAGHIHKGVKGEAGSIKVTLFDEQPPTTTVEDCTREVKKKLLKRIARGPERFYVNVHNEAYPEGAIRGQLKPAF